MAKDAQVPVNVPAMPKGVERSQVKVIKKKKSAIVVYQIRKGKYRAFDESNPDLKAAGRTAASAIGSLIRLNQEHFGMSVKSASLSEKDGRIEVESESST